MQLHFAALVTRPVLFPNVSTDEEISDISATYFMATKATAEKTSRSNTVYNIFSFFILIHIQNMSKCQMNKYKAGGRCVSTTITASKECSSSVSSTSAAMASLLAAREQQDRLFAPSATVSTEVPQKSSIVVRKSQEGAIDKKACIDVILGGDF